jgi:hypothetical protein
MFDERSGIGKKIEMKQEGDLVVPCPERCTVSVLRYQMTNTLSVLTDH